MKSIKIINFFYRFLILTLIVGITSCSKEEDRSGDPITKGKSVVNAYSFVVENEFWEREDTLKYTARVSALKMDVIEEGGIFIYARSLDEFLKDNLLPANWSIIPYFKTGFIPIQGEESTITFEYALEEEFVNLEIFNDKSVPFPQTIPGQTGDFPFPGEVEYLVVVIPPSDLINGIESDLNYEELNKLYTINEIEL